MWPESSEQVAPLRSGLTTGCCATACCVAAATAIFSKDHHQPAEVEVTLPKGKLVKLAIQSYDPLPQGIRTSTIKDAGDDPDVTHGATIFVELTLVVEPGIHFAAASGVGTVTKTGLLLAIGEPAINPVPREMMSKHLQNFAQTYQYAGGFSVAVGVVDGELIAQKTMNPRLGILGGLSILGTTGIVRPFSCAAYIASIHQGIDVARANGITHIAATTGNMSEQAVKEHHQLSEMALIEMGDFIGAVLKHIKKVEMQSKQLRKVSICGGFGKLTKLAKQHMDLNSRASSIDFFYLATLAGKLGADDDLQQAIMQANTTMEVLSLCQQNHINLPKAVCHDALVFVRQYIPSHIDVEILAIDRGGKFVAMGNDALEFNAIDHIAKNSDV